MKRIKILGLIFIASIAIIGYTFYLNKEYIEAISFIKLSTKRGINLSKSSELPIPKSSLAKLIKKRFYWHWTDLLFPLEVHHNDKVVAVSWNSNGSMIASGSEDKNIRIIDAKTGNLIKQIPQDTFINSLAWSPDGSMIASADRNLRIIDVKNGSTIKSIPHAGESITSVVWSSDGNLIASSSIDKNVSIIDVKTYNIIKQLPQDKAVFSLAWSPDGSLLAFGFANSNLRIINVKTGRVIKQIPPVSWVMSLAWSPDGTKIAIGSTDNNLRIIDVKTSRVVQQASYAGWVMSVAWSPDGTKIATGSADGNLRIHLLPNVSDNQLLARAQLYYLKQLNIRNEKLKQELWLELKNNNSF